MFLMMLPLGLVTLLLAYRYLPADQRKADTVGSGFDPLGSLLLGLTLGAYALAMTLGRGHFGPLNIALLLVTCVGVGLFIRVEARVAAPLIRLGMFRDPQLSASLAMSLLVTTVIMATLVVGPFYLARALGLDAVGVGLVLSVGPLVAALAGVPAGRMADRFGARRMTLAGLIALGLGCFTLSALPDIRYRRLPRTHGHHHPGLRGVPDRQQYRCHEQCGAGPAGSGLRVAQPVAQSRADHRRLGAGRGVCAGIEFDRHQCRASRGGCQRHARDVRGGMGTDRDCVFDRPGQPTRRTCLSRRRAGRHGVVLARHSVRRARDGLEQVFRADVADH
jgi:hypothetical protein